MPLLGKSMFSFFAPWLPVMAIIFFIAGMLRGANRDQDPVVTAFQLNVPVAALGIAMMPSFLFILLVTVPGATAGVFLRRRLQRSR